MVYRLLCFLIMAGPLSSVQAETLILQEGLEGYRGTEDNSIYQDRPNNTNGAGPQLFSGATTSSVRRALVRFDLSALPETAQITRVELELTVDRSGRGAANSDVYRLHRLTAAWGEGEVVAEPPGGLGSPAQTGDATWLQRFFEQDAWQSPGGDFEAAASAMAPVPAQPGGAALLSGEGMAADVQLWLNDPTENHGWILIGDEAGSNNSRRFNSSENATHPPKLTIEFETETRVKHWALF